MTPSSVDPKVDDYVSHLLIVCCHAIWLGGPKDGQDEFEWYLRLFIQCDLLTSLTKIWADWLTESLIPSLLSQYL